MSDEVVLAGERVRRDVLDREPLREGISTDNMQHRIERTVTNARSGPMVADGAWASFSINETIAQPTGSDSRPPSTRWADSSASGQP